MSRLLVGNLDCEVAWAGAAGRPLPGRVLDLASEAALALAALAAPGDRLWTPRPAPELEGVELVSGPLAAQAPAAAILAWGETDEVAALRAHGPAAPPPAIGASLAELLWACRPSPQVARACNDRALAFAVAERRGWTHPGSRWLASVSELEAHLAADGADSWVLKAPFSAAGRERLRRRGRRLDDASRARAGRLFARFGRLLYEPWVTRDSDFGVAGVVLRGGEARLLAPHRQEVDAAGVVRAVELGAPAIAPAEATEAARAAAGALAAAGYVGPFSIDGYVHLAGGRRRVHPLSEINARLTFGLVAHAAAERRGRPALRLDLPKLTAGP